MPNEQLLSTLANVTETPTEIYAYLTDEINQTKYRFLFNPESKAFNLRANYSSSNFATSDLPSQNYNYTTGLTLTLNNLILESKSRQKSVKPLLDQLVALLKADPAKGRLTPNTVFFRWGSSSFGPALITSLDWVETSWVGAAVEPASVRLNLTLIQVPAKNALRSSTQTISQASSSAQPLTAREKAEASNKAKQFLQENIKKLSESISQLVRSNNYSLLTSPNGTVELQNSKNVKLGTVGNYKGGKFTGKII